MTRNEIEQELRKDRAFLAEVGVDLDEIMSEDEKAERAEALRASCSMGGTW